MSKKTVKWITYLCMMSFLWLVCAALAATFTYNAAVYPNKEMCIISGVYLFVLLMVIMVGNIARVRMLMFMTSVYSVAVCVRGVFGVLISILVMDKPQNKLWFSILDAITLPFTGFHYIASLLTSHFVTEIYWLGLVCISLITLCFSLAGFMAVTGRNKEITYNTQNREQMDRMIQEKKKKIEENKKFLETISYDDKK